MSQINVYWIMYQEEGKCKKNNSNFHKIYFKNRESEYRVGLNF